MEQTLGEAAAAALELPELQSAFAAIERADGETLADMCAITAIPAPLLGEAARAQWLAGRFAELGVPHIRIDAAGNVLAGAPDEDVPSALMLAAHLDTVFPAETDVRVRRRAGRLRAPGIADNGRGVAAMLRLAAVLQHATLLRHPVLFAGTVGEEGAGDLRGVKHLFREQAPRPLAFLAIDGAGMQRIVHRAVGSRRLRVRITGPGGHSWSDRGQPNAVHALAVAVAELEAQRSSLGDDATINTGRIGGGTSVNAIPESAWLELDLRAEDDALLTRMEARARQVFAAVAEPPLRLEIELMGDRPGARLPADAPLVQAACMATAHFGMQPELGSASTDANVPMALGIPAIALGAGGEAAGMHTLSEYYVNERGPAGIQRLLLTLVLADPLL